MFSADVTAGDNILASQYSNLQKDVLFGGDMWTSWVIGHTHVSGGGGKLYRNLANTRLGTDFNTGSTSWVTRTGGTVSLTTTQSKILLNVRSVWKVAGGSPESLVHGRINRDSGAEYVSLGAGATHANNTDYMWFYLGGGILFTGLSAGVHTFTFEVKVSAAAGTPTTNNDCSTSGDDYCFELVAEEI